MNPNMIYGFSGLDSMFDRPQTYLDICEENDIPLPVEYFEHLFNLLPTPVCARFNWSFQEFFDYVNKYDKETIYEQKC